MSRSLLVIVAGAMAATAALAQPKAGDAGAKPIARSQFIASMDAEFRKLDADRNGQLTQLEMEQFERTKAEDEVRARNRAQFAELDTNKDRQLSPTEFARLVTPPTVASAQPTVTRMDSNRDNQISPAEYRAATLVNFDRLDTDRDGIVTPSELKAGGIAPR